MNQYTLDHALSISKEARYDAVCKAILRNRIILANILKEVVEEYKDYDVETIAEHFIEPDTISSSVPVGRNIEFGKTPENIVGAAGEDSTITEGTV
ncbi:MAG: hypothetical protein J6B85_11050 [Lachnospiraceae bacterium]|nr:hypothetical protein [Lachnospiraceae bacterium]